MIRLALVDDDSRFLSALKTRLAEFSEIGPVMSSTSGMRFARELAALPAQERPEVIVMDIAMSTPDEGIHAASKIKEDFPEIQIIMFTISDKEDLVFEAFKAGAMGYLLKNESPEFIVKTILDVKQGEAQMSPSIARKTIQFLANSKAPETKKDHFLLSTRELETINLVAKGYTYSQIGELLHIAPSTAKKHMTNIFEKLHVKNKIEALLKTEAYREAHQAHKF